MEVVIFIGAQGSGKSTFFQERFRDTHLRINLDMLRTRLRERGIIDACLAFKQPLVIDNTNPTQDQRAVYLKKARAAKFAATAYFFDVPGEHLLARNAQRTGKARVPERAVLSTLRMLQRPSREEGFDAIYTVCAYGNGEFSVEEIADEI